MSAQESKLALFILLPDFQAPANHRRQRFPPLGPALVAACAAPLGLRFKAVDLLVEQETLITPSEAEALEDGARVMSHLAGDEDAEIGAALERCFERLLLTINTTPEFVAISADRGSQLYSAALFSREAKLRWESNVIVGGVITNQLTDLFTRVDTVGPDIVTRANQPADVVSAFECLVDMPRRRRGPPVEPIGAPLARLKTAPKISLAAARPMPDFGIYELDRYRRDPLGVELAADTRYGGQLGTHLTLPYHFTVGCQFACAFCQNGGVLQHKAIDQVVRELATLSERWETQAFIFFNAQTNRIAPQLAQGLIDANVDLRWSDSYRVRPSTVEELELMARGGCASLTVGVESASDIVLKKMVKGHRQKHATAMLETLDQLSILVRVNLLAGFPGETETEFQHTLQWLEHHAPKIDDIAPSAFYLTRESPVGRDPKRFGVRIRGPRTLEGPLRFRKVLDSLEYDVVDGMPWEELEPWLGETEGRLLAAYRNGLPDRRRLSGMPLPLTNVLRCRFESKADIYAAIDEWCPGQPDAQDAGPPVAARLEATAAVSAAVASALRAIPGSALTSVEPSSTLHALLLSDGSYVLFRGRVSRSGLKLGIVFEELVAAHSGAPASGWCELALAPDARLAISGRVALLRADATDPQPCRIELSAAPEVVSVVAHA